MVEDVEYVEEAAAPAAPDEIAAKIHLHLYLLLGTGVIVALAGFFAIKSNVGDGVWLPGTSFRLPVLCMYRSLLGLDCPGCGLTRSFVAIMRGDLLAAWRFNPAGLLFFVVVASQIPWRIAQIWRLKRGAEELPAGRLGQVLLLSMAVALIGQWLARGWGGWLW